ncbi:MAG: PQQ-binding-like beta-propeller repeat protein [Thermoguttaceae bacterium]
MATELDDIVFVGLNSRVAALDANTGTIVWDWRAPTGSGYVSLLLLDGNRLIASVSGYTYCLDPGTGRQHWFNELTGFGTGVVSIVAVDKCNPHDPVVAAAASDAADAAAAAS